MKRGAQWFAVLALASLHVWLAHSASREFGHTGDENAHLTGGYSYWRLDDYRLHPENGNLAQRWLALPLLAQELNFPPQGSRAWRRGDYWPVSDAFLYESGNDVTAMLGAARGMSAVLGGALVFVVFIWSRALFGPRAAWLSAGLAAFCPHLLAHAGLANSDLAASLAFLVALLTWWRLLHRVSIVRVGCAGVAAGALMLTKFSGGLFLPIAATLTVVRLLRPEARATAVGRAGQSRGAHLARLLSAQLVAGAIAVGVLWAAFGFRFSASNPGTERVEWDWDRITHGAQGGKTITGHFATFAREHRLLPEAWLYGLAYVQRAAEKRPNFLAGSFSADGHWDFFPVAFAIKTTLGALLIILLAAVLPWRAPRRRTMRWLYRLAPLLIFVAVYGTVAVASTINIGHRHILPLYPALYILAGAVVCSLNRRPSRCWAIVVGGALAWHIAASCWVRPHYLAYFNEWGGGPREGHRYLVDSSLDWGQGLPGLQRWLAQVQEGERVFLAYFGTDRPERLGLTVTRFGDEPFDLQPRPPPAALEPGLYVISATLLHQPYALWPGYWSTLRERSYFAHRARLAEQAELRGDWPDDDPRARDYDLRWRAFDQVRFGRLCHFLRSRKPDAHIGYALFIYRLTADDLSRYLDEPLPP